MSAESSPMPVETLWAWFLQVVLRRPPYTVEDDGFPEPVGNHAAFTTFLEGPCLLLYGYLLLIALTWAAWGAYRAAAWRRLSLAGRGRQGAEATGLHRPLLGQQRRRAAGRHTFSQRLVDAQGRTIFLEGFSHSRVGAAASWLVVTTSALVMFVFVVILYDYYSGCEWSWPQQLCYIGNFPLTGSFETNSSAFLATWSFGTCWFALLVFGRGGHVANLFRLHAPFHSADHILVTVQEQQATLASGYSRTLAGVDHLWGLLRRLAGAGGQPGSLPGLTGTQAQTVPLRWGEEVQAYYIEFRCACYVLDPVRHEGGGFVQYHANASELGGYAAFEAILANGGLRRLEGSDGGTPSVEAIYRKAGPNKIPFEVDAWLSAVREEFSTLFFLYQFSIYSVCLWFSYWHYTIIALGVAVASGILAVQVRISNQREISALLQQTFSIEVLRDGKVTTVPSEGVVPGDIVKVQGCGWQVPCDLCLLKGAAVCDESSLTGESMPVQRIAPNEPLGDLSADGRPPSKHALVAGTRVLQVSGKDGEDCWAIATHTGIQTQRGQLFLLILFPPKLLVKYDEQLLLVFSFLLGYALFVMCASMKIMYVRYASDQDLPLTATWATGVFTCSCVLPTMLHVVLSIGQVVAAQRLKTGESGVFTAAPKRIALAGKVRVACFDKTGTMTTSSLEFYGVHCVRPLQKAPSDDGPFGGWVAAPRGAARRPAPSLEARPRRGGLPPEVLCGLAGAHSLSPFAADPSGVVGNAVEVSMFQASGWTMPSPGEVVGPAGQGSRMRIHKRFDFSHSTMTMSAVVEHFPSGTSGVFCKGAYDQVVLRCLPETVPADLAAVASAHAFSGKYVLAIAARPLQPGEVDVSTRDEAEQGLVLLGLVLFENPLRVDSGAALRRLREGGVRSVMITGDAVGTAACIARQAELVAPGVPVLFGDVRLDAGGAAEVVWTCREEDLTAMSEFLLGNTWLTFRRNYQQWRTGQTTGARGETSALLVDPPPSTSTADMLSPRGPAGSPGGRGAERADEQHAFTTEELVLSRLFEWCELAVTQRAFEELRATPCGPEVRRALLGSRLTSLKRGRALSGDAVESTLAGELLTNIRIFARMTPQGKIDVVEGFMRQGLITSMCGDGGNDSGALRTAHLGMALSSATSATVVAPFTTRVPSISPLADLLREGRGALATNFAGYKYCVHYGLLNSALKFMMYWHGISRPMAAAYLQDMVGFLSFSWAVGLSRPAESLVGERPTSSLFSPTTVGSVVGLWLINVVAMEVGMHLCTSHDDFVPFPVHLVRITQWWKLSRNWETTTLFFTYTFAQFWSAVVFSFGHHFRLAWYMNLTLLAFASCGLAFMSYLLVCEPNAATRSFHLAYEEVTQYEPWSPELPCPAMPFELRMQLLYLVAGALVTGAAWEKIIVLGSIGRRLRDRWRSMSKHITLRL